MSPTRARAWGSVLSHARREGGKEGGKEGGREGGRREGGRRFPKSWVVTNTFSVTVMDH